MSPTPIRRFSLDYAFAVLLFAAVVVLVFYRIQDADFFWHIANGKAMVEQGRIVNEEIFSYTRPGTPFSNHEWLAQIILYLVFKQFGALGVVAFKSALVGLMAVLLYQTARFQKADAIWSALLAAGVVLEGLIRYRERPEIFSLLLLTLLAFLLTGFTAGRVRKAFLYSIPCILVVWDFLHGALFGLIYLAAFVTAETVKYARQRKERSSADSGAMKSLWAVAGVTLAAMVINPYGLRSYDIFLEFLRSKNQLVMNTGEFTPPTLALFPLFYLWLLLVALAVVLRGRKNDLTSLFVTLPFAVLALRYRRVLPFFGLVSVPVLAAYLAAAAQTWAKPRVLQAAAYCLSALFVGYVVFLKFFAPDGPYSFGYQVNKITFPVGSTRFVNQSGLTGNMYNPGHYGGYLAYYAYPRHKIYLYNHHIVFGDFPAGFTDAALRPYGVEFGVLDRFWGGDEKDFNVLAQSGWALLFWDDSSFVVARRTGANAAYVASHELKYFTPEVQDALFNYQSKHAILDRFESNPALALQLTREIGSCLACYDNKVLADYLGYLVLLCRNGMSAAEGSQLVDGALKWNPESAYLWFAESRFRRQMGDFSRAEFALQKSRSLDGALVSKLEQQM